MVNKLKIRNINAVKLIKIVARTVKYICTNTFIFSQKFFGFDLNYKPGFPFWPFSWMSKIHCPQTKDRRTRRRRRRRPEPWIRIYSRANQFSSSNSFASSTASCQALPFLQGCCYTPVPICHPRQFSQNKHVNDNYGLKNQPIWSFLLLYCHRVICLKMCY